MIEMGRMIEESATVDGLARPSLSGDQLVAALKAIGEPTRLRIAALVAGGELTVTELCRILGQSQPRVSRHLRLLCDAELLERHSEGTNAFFSTSSEQNGRLLLQTVVEFVDVDDPQLAADRHRLALIRSERAALADDYFDTVAAQWDTLRSRHVAEAEVEAEMVNLIDRHRGLTSRRGAGTLLDVGTGTGRILELLADRFEYGIGIDLSTNMLNLARTRLLDQGLSHCSVRQANVYALDTGGRDGGQLADVAVLHHVLHFLDDPAAALRQTALAVAPGGLVMVVDFAPHSVAELRSEHNHRWMGFSDQEIESWAEDAWLEVVEARELRLKGQSIDEPLVVAIWLARRQLQSAA